MILCLQFCSRCAPDQSLKGLFPEPDRLGLNLSCSRWSQVNHCQESYSASLCQCFFICEYRAVTLVMEVNYSVIVIIKQCLSFFCSYHPATFACLKVFERFTTYKQPDTFLSLNANIQIITELNQIKIECKK